MTPEAQRIAIAEACGWKNIVMVASPEINGYEPVGTNPNNKDVQVQQLDNLPNYLHDLNAMHEAEKEVIFKQGKEKTYFSHLYNLINQECVRATGYEFDDLVSCNEVATHAVSSTASQRAEAFLRTIGKWTETK